MEARRRRPLLLPLLGLLLGPLQLAAGSERGAVGMLPRPQLPKARVPQADKPNNSTGHRQDRQHIQIQ